MKNLLLALPLITLGSVAAAEETITYPKDACFEIVGTDYSTPGGDSSRYVFEMLCKDREGNHKVFVTSWATTGAFLGFGRASTNVTISLVPGNVTGLRKD